MSEPIKALGTCELPTCEEYEETGSHIRTDACINWKKVAADEERKPCHCGMDACVGTDKIRAPFVCVREAGMCAIKRVSIPTIPIADASEGVKRPTCFEYYAADMGEEIKSYFDADPVYAYMDYLESQLAAKDAEISQLKAKLQSMSGDH